MHSSKLIGLLATLHSLCDQAFAAKIDIGTAAPYGVIANTSITNTGNTIVDGLLGISPGTAVTGFPPGISDGINSANTAASKAVDDARTAYELCTSLYPTGSTGLELGGQILTSGTYNAPSSVGLTGTLILDGQQNPNALFVFQIPSTLITATASSVILINGAQAQNVFWQVGTSATLGVRSRFAGNILAAVSITATTEVIVDGSLLALNGAVTLDSNRIMKPPIMSSSVLVSATAVSSVSDSTPVSLAPSLTSPGYDISSSLMTSSTAVASSSVSPSGSSATSSSISMVTSVFITSSNTILTSSLTSATIPSSSTPSLEPSSTPSSLSLPTSATTSPSVSSAKSSTSCSTTPPIFYPTAPSTSCSTTTSTSCSTTPSTSCSTIAIPALSTFSTRTTSLSHGLSPQYQTAVIKPWKISHKLHESDHRHRKPNNFCYQAEASCRMPKIFCRKLKVPCHESKTFRKSTVQVLEDLV